MTGYMDNNRDRFITPEEAEQEERDMEEMVADFAREAEMRRMAGYDRLARDIREDAINIARSAFSLPTGDWT